MARWSSQSTHTDISDFSDNPHLKRELKIWRLKIAGVVLGVLAVIGISSRPVYHAFRESQINKNLDAAKEAARLEDWGLARDRARSVLLARDGDFDAYRIWTRALGKMGESRTYMAAASLFADQRATSDDKLECLRVMSTQAPQALALSAFASLPNDLKEAADFRAALTPVLVLRGDVGVAEQGLRQFMGSRPSPEARLELLRVLCAEPKPDRITEARAIFAQLFAENANEQVLAALLIFGETPGALSPEESLPKLPDLRSWLDYQAGAKTLHHLFALHPEIASKPDHADALFEDAIDRFLATDPGVLGTWLNLHGKTSRVVSLLEEPAKTRSDAFIARLHALLRERRETELAEALENPPDAADMVETEIIRAVMAVGRKDHAAASVAWTRAMNHAAFDTSRNRFIEIARAAQSFDSTDAASLAWVGAVCSGWGQFPLYRDLLPVFATLAGKGRSEDLLAMCRSLRRFEPLNQQLINNVNYLELIHGIQPAAQVIRSQSLLVESSPEMPEFRSTLMLAQMVAGDARAAIQNLDALKGSKRVAPMMKNALEGSCRLLLGETEEGQRLLKEVVWKSFMRQERIAFRDLLVKLQIAELPLPELEQEVVSADPTELPAWRKVVEKMERERANEILPPLPQPVVPEIEPAQ